jgi:hypothetical protein
VFIQVSHSLLKGRDYTIFFVVGWKYDTQTHLGRFNISSIRSRECLDGLDMLLANLALSKPAIVPTGEWLGLCASGNRIAGDVLLFGDVNRARLWRNEMQDDIELRGVV